MTSVRRTVMLLCLALAITGCSGGTKHTVGTPSGAPSGSATGTSGSAAQAAPASGGATGLPSAAAPVKVVAPPLGLNAYTLLSSAGLPAALGTAIVGYQDDGGYTDPSTSSFSSVAETQTMLTHLQVTLNTYADAATAAQYYPRLAPQGGNPLPGVGDKAVESDDQVVVLKGSQILMVSQALTTAGETYVAGTDKSPASIATALEKPGIATATAIASHLTGASASGTYVQLPDGAVNPCAGTPAALTAAAKEPATLANSQSESPPALQCDVLINGRPFLQDTYTAAQAAKAVPATTLQAQFADDQQQSGRGRVQATIGPFQAFANLDTDWTVEILMTNGSAPAAASPAAFRLGPEAASGGPAQGAPSPGGLILVKVKNGYTFIVDYNECYALMMNEIYDVLGPSFDALSGEPLSQSVQMRLHDQLLEWCEGLNDRSPTNPDG